VDVEQVNRYCQASDLFILAGTGPRPFEQIQFLRGTENVFLDLAEGRTELNSLLNLFHQFYLSELEVWAQTEVDGLFFQDDWGSQQNLLISPKTWRLYFKPLYRDYIALAHSHGKKAFMHSDGNISAIYPDLVEIGLDAINSQLFCMDIEALGRQFAGKITFWGEMDRQHLLPFGTLEEINRAVIRVKAALYQRGGVIAQCDFGIGARFQNILQVFETWEELFK
jgi:uroporphyrinogen decarboxylase